MDVHIIIHLLLMSSPGIVHGQSFWERFLNIFGSNNLATQFTDSVDGFIICASDEPDTHDKYLGTMSRNESYFCTPQTQRLPLHIFCCTPQTSDEIRFLVSTPDGQFSSHEVKFYNLNGRYIFHGTKKVVYLVHGWLEKVSTSSWVNQTRDGYLKRGHVVVVVDWGHLNQLNYWQSIANVRTVGAAIGHSILKWNVTDKTLIVGFSLGAQIAAEAGKFINRNGNGRQIAECHGIDPAGPWFDPIHGFIADMQLDKSDCKIVQVVHSSASNNPNASIASIATLNFGTGLKSGHCDFWINCGHDQSDLCQSSINMIDWMDKITTISNDGGNQMVGYIQQQFMCSHFRSIMMYADAVNRRCDKNPNGVYCTDCGPTAPSSLGSRHECTARPDLGTQFFPPDNVCNPADDVNYVVFTTITEPYCQGNQNID